MRRGSPEPDIILGHCLALRARLIPMRQHGHRRADRGGDSRGHFVVVVTRTEAALVRALVRAGAMGRCEVLAEARALGLTSMGQPRSGRSGCSLACPAARSHHVVLPLVHRQARRVVAERRRRGQAAAIDTLLCELQEQFASPACADCRAVVSLAACWQLSAQAPALPGSTAGNTASGAALPLPLIAAVRSAGADRAVAEPCGEHPFGEACAASL